MSKNAGRSRWWQRGLLAGALAAAAVVPTRAADLDTELAELTSAISARIAASDSAKETKKLGKAQKKLDATTAATTDGKALSKILSAVFGSKTVDATVIAEAQDVLDCLRELAAAQKLEAQSFLDQLETKFANKLIAKISAGDKRLDAGVALVADNPKKAAALFRKALDKYVKSAAFAQKALQRQNAPPKLGNSPRVVATLTGGGSTVKFNEFGVRFADFGQLTVLGCDAQGPEGVCRTSLGFTIFYAADSRETGSPQTTFIDYAESSDFGNGSGPGVQDRRWTGSAQVTVTESTNGRIKGTFTGQMQADQGQSPQTYDVTGTFVVKRP